MIAWFKSLLRRLSPHPRRGRGHSAGGHPDAELREVFLVEMAEVTRSLRAACAILRDKPADQDALKGLRRGFHTLKGSAPLVGATALGEFCAQIETLMSRLVETPSKVSAETISTVERAIAVLPLFVQSMHDTRRSPSEARVIAERVRRLATH